MVRNERTWLIIAGCFALLCSLRAVPSKKEMIGEETGTLNTAAIIHNSVILTADSALSSKQGVRSDGTFKIVQVGAQAACTVEGHTDEILHGEHLFIVGKELASFGQKEPVDDLQQAFPALMDNVRSTLRNANALKMKLGFALTRSERDPRYFQAPDRYYVTGIICAGVSSGKPLIRAAHISTDPAVYLGDMRVDDDLVTDHIAQGFPDGYMGLFDNGRWPDVKPMPNWQSFTRASGILSSSIADRHSLQGVSAQAYDDLLRGVYWSAITGNAGILPPVRRWVVRVGSPMLSKSDLLIPYLPD